MTILSRGLRLVPYQPDDYSLGSALTLEDTTVVIDAPSVAAALSLYFQWEDDRSACVVSELSELGYIPISLDYDRDEATPTEFRILCNNDSRWPTSEFTRILIRIEVFRTCYEFECNVLAVSADPASDGFDAIIAAPAELKIRKARRLPRVTITPELRSGLPPILWHERAAPPESVIPLIVNELGTTSLRVTRVDSLKLGNGKVQAGELALDATIVRIDRDNAIVQLEFRDGTAFGQYFDFYRRFAYPSLRGRYELTYDEAIEVLSASTYFGKYERDKSEAEKGALKETWDAIRPGHHQTTATYLITDPSGHAVGTSSTTLATFEGNIPVWFFHELCAVKIPELVAQSGVLYAWRAEYLAARPEDLSVAVCFHSKSRWVERMYVKHAMSSDSLSTLYPSRFIRQSVSPAASVSIPYQRYEVGMAPRVSSMTSKLWAAAGPPLLNANESLDTVVAVARPATGVEITGHAAQIAALNGTAATDFLFIVPHDFNTPELHGKVHLADRIYQIEKKDLVNLIASIEHSVAVTRRKMESGIAV